MAKDKSGKIKKIGNQFRPDLNNGHLSSGQPEIAGIWLPTIQIIYWIIINQLSMLDIHISRHMASVQFKPLNDLFRPT